jgi:hypothetical protein
MSEYGPGNEDYEYDKHRQEEVDAESDRLEKVKEAFKHGMIIRVAYPPLIEKIDEVFHVKGRPILYAWEQFIYNPAGVPVSRPLVSHEATHGIRQIEYGGAEKWWERYLLDSAFVLEEEIIAHKMEWEAVKAIYKDRNIRAVQLQKIARKLSSPLYGGGKPLLTFTEARKILL